MTYTLNKDLTRKRFGTIVEGTQIFLNKQKNDTESKFYDLHWNWICNQNTWSTKNNIDVIEDVVGVTEG